MTVRGCPLGTVQHRCEWQASGTGQQGRRSRRWPRSIQPWLFGWGPPSVARPRWQAVEDGAAAPSGRGRLSAPVLRDQGPTDQPPGTARPMQASRRQEAT